ncbi:hypothetical protein CYY_006114 [Polysphondylium violaceum]|uniref:AAA+ ATPase domain-containing protein n=1 Tax=Polysphondylium violaceum TaxID=133409 RepID=A0A8J4PR76_9MYCE|nr:hypothetical protein CYY_006114 [Polysphondylium violaceum]
MVINNNSSGGSGSGDKLILYPLDSSLIDNNIQIDQQSRYVNENCYISVHLFDKYHLRLGDWVFLEIHSNSSNNNNNNSNQCLISKVWTSRYIQQDQYIQANQSIILFRNNNSFDENIYSNLVSIHKINQYDSKLNEIDIKIIIQDTSDNNDKKNGNHSSLNEYKSLLYKKQFIKELLLYKMVAKGCFVQTNYKDIRIHIVNINNSENSIGIVTTSTKINIIDDNSESGGNNNDNRQQETSSKYLAFKSNLLDIYTINKTQGIQNSIGGMNDKIISLEEMIIYPILFPLVFEKLSISPPKGILLKGPPGTGKTHLVRSFCDSYQIKMFSIDCTKISGVYLGETEENLRNAFQEISDYSVANDNIPAVLFIDEIDTICPQRSKSNQNESRVVGQFLTLLDGMDGRKGNFVVIAATNRPNQIDPAMRRPGRLDREIEIPVPTKEQRLQILSVYAKSLPISSDPPNLLEIVAEETVGYVGANIQFLCRDASLIAFSRVKNSPADQSSATMFIELQDFRESIRHNPASILKGDSLVQVSNITWDDIGGLEDVKQQLKQAIEWPNLYKDSFARLGLSPPKGIILYGPPGCSKTTLVKAIANSSKLSFLSLSGASIFSPYLGDSEAAIREVFKKARQTIPSILFFDEIDAIVSKRNEGENKSTELGLLSTFLNEMDGVEQLNGVIVIGATNRIDMLDPALLRPGRFDKIIEISLPDQDTRLKILQVKTKKIPIANDVDLIKISEITRGYNGADIENLCREASFQCLRRNIENPGQVTMNDFLSILKPQERKQKDNISLF